MCPQGRAHWRHLANTIELVLPSAYPSPQPKRQSDRFSRFCTAHGRKCLYFTMEDPFHKNCPFSWGSGPHLFHDFLRQTEPNCITLGSATFAQVTTECPYTLQWAPLSPKIAPSHGDLDPHVRHDLLDPSEPTDQTAIDSAVFAQMTAECPCTLQWDAAFPLKIAPSHGSGPLSNTWFPGPIRVLSPNGISIGSAVLAGLTSMTDRQTDRPRNSVGNNRPHLRCDAV